MQNTENTSWSLISLFTKQKIHLFQGCHVNNKVKAQEEMQTLSLQPKSRCPPSTVKLTVFHPAQQKQQHPTDRVSAQTPQRPRLDSFCRNRRRRNCCHLSSVQSRENKGDSHCHCLHLQLIITSTSKAVACAVISTAGNVTTRPTAQTTTSARALVHPAPSEGGGRADRQHGKDKRN